MVHCRYKGDVNIVCKSVHLELLLLCQSLFSNTQPTRKSYEHLLPMHRGMPQKYLWKHHQSMHGRGDIQTRDKHLVKEMDKHLPETWGQAMEVPLMVLVASSPLIHVEVMSTPGAKISTQAPQLEKEARASDESVAPTVMAQ